MMRFWLALPCLLVAPLTSADWVTVGAATKCDKDQGTFIIEATMDTSSEEANIPPSRGFSPVPRGTTSIDCKLATTSIEAVIAAYEADNGMCMGAGFVGITSLRVGTHSVVDSQMPFNWQCPTNPIVIRITVKDSQSPEPAVEFCTAKDWDWSGGYKDVHCSSEVPGL